MSHILEEHCNWILAAMMNGIYQGLLLTAVLMLLFKVTKGLNAATRHAVSLGVLGLVALLPIIHFLLPSAKKVDKEEVIQSGVVISATPTELSRTHESPRWPIREKTDLSPLDTELLIESRTWGTPQVEHQNPAISPPEGVAEEHRIQPSEATRKELNLSRTDYPKIDREDMQFILDPEWIEFSSWPQWLVSTLPNPWSMKATLPRLVGITLIALWIIPAMVRLGRLIWQHVQLHRLKQQGSHPPQPVAEFCDQLRKEFGLRRKVQLKICEEAVVPMVLGFHPATIILPAKLAEELDEDQLEQVLRHELAHLRRNDDWANLFQQTIKAFYFFHPAVCWLSHRLTLEREIACDDHVLAVANNPRAYALFLTDFSGRMRRRHCPAAPAAWSNKHQLKERISMILNTQRNTSPQLARVSLGILTTAAASLAFLAVQAGPRLALGQEPPAISEESVKASDPAPTVPIDPNTPSDLKNKANETASSVVDPVLPPPPPRAVYAPAGSNAGSRSVISPAQPAQPMTPPPPDRASAGNLVIGLPTPVVAAHVTGMPVYIASTSAPRAESSGDLTIEQRLARLERLVESLLEREKNKPFETGNDLFTSKGGNPDRVLQEIGANLRKLDETKLNENQLRQTNEIAKEASERAAEEIKRAKEQHERAMEYYKEKSHLEQPNIKIEPPLQQQQRQLDQQRRALEKQMEALNRQLARLAAEQERLANKQEALAEEHEKAAQQYADHPKPPKAKTLKPSQIPSPAAPELESSEDSDKKVKKF